jgi:hypothetical protein
MISQGAREIPRSSNLRWGFDMYNWKRCYVGATGTNSLPTTTSGAYNSFYSARGSNEANLRVRLINTATPVADYPASQAHYVTWMPSAQTGYYSGGSEATGLCRSSAVSVSNCSLNQCYGVWVYVYDEEWTRYNNSVNMYVTGSRGLGAFADYGQRRTDRTGRVWRHYQNINTYSNDAVAGGEYHAFHLKNTITTPLRVLYAGPTFFKDNNTTGYCPMWSQGARYYNECSYNIADSSMPGNGHYNLTYTTDGLFKFNGINSKINTYNLGTMVNTTLCSTFTRESTTTSGSMHLLYRENNGSYTTNSDNHSIYVNTDGSCDTHIEFSQTDNDHSIRAADVTSVIGEPCCVVSTYDHASRSLKIYFDGVLRGTKSITNEPGNPYTGAIGYTMGCQSGTNHGGVAADRGFFKGTIHNSYIHDVALTDAEVAVMSDMCLKNVP